jgi:hypothetical protein
MAVLGRSFLPRSDRLDSLRKLPYNDTTLERYAKRLRGECHDHRATAFVSR